MDRDRNAWSGHFATPESLFQLAVDTVIVNFKSLFAGEQTFDIPSKITNILLEAYQRKNRILDEDFLFTIASPNIKKPTKIHIRKRIIGTIGKDYITILVTKNIEELSLDVDGIIPENFLFLLNNNADNLQVLSINQTVYNELFRPAFKLHYNKSVAYKNWPCILQAPNLESLTIRSNDHYSLDSVYSAPEFLWKLFRNLKKLRHLDLCYNYVKLLRSQAPNKNFLYFFESTTITSLILYNVELLDDDFETLGSLKNLEHLDISALRYSHSGSLNCVALSYKRAGLKLRSLIESLPNLVSLDISQTNLDEPDQGSKEIFGLKSRKDNPLEFLGLYWTRHKSCEWENIPAKIITGNANFEQLKNAAVAYSERQKTVLNIFKDLTKTEIKQEDVYSAVDIVLKLLDKHLDLIMGHDYFKNSFEYPMQLLESSLMRQEFSFSMKQQAIKKFLDILNRLDSPNVHTIKSAGETLIRLMQSSNEINSYILPLINLILKFLKEPMAIPCVALKFIKIIDQNQKLLFVGQGGMVELMKLIRCHDYDSENKSFLWEIVEHLIKGNETLTEMFLKDGAQLFSECLPLMKEDRWPDLLLYYSSKVFIEIILQFGSKFDRYMTGDRFLENLLEVFLGSVEKSYQYFPVGFTLAKLISKKPYFIDESKCDKILKIFHRYFRNKLDIDLDIDYDLSDPLIDLMRKSELPECKSIVIWGLYSILHIKGLTVEERELFVQKLKGLKSYLDDYISNYGSLCPEVTEFAEFLRGVN